VPALPDTAPCQGRDGKACRLVCDHYRPRKTGPRFPVLVVCCRVHGIAFTLYPPGHVPYGRAPIAPVAPDGSPWAGTGESHPFAGTLFDAALDAAAGEAWPADFDDAHPTCNAKPRFGTQLTHLARACELTGVGLAPERRELCTQVLAVPGPIDRTTVWLRLRRRGLVTARARHPKTRDCRRFAYAHRMDRVLCDSKHFRAGPKRLRRVALVFLDDATRFGLEVVVGTAETTALFLRGLYRCVPGYGRMSSLYVDNGHRRSLRGRCLSRPWLSRSLHRCAAA